MLQLVNRDRRYHGLLKLRMQNDLRDVARRHSRDMARKDYFAHENTAGESPSDRIKSARISDTMTGENLAKLRGYPHPTDEAQRGLMNSPGHRANILQPKYNCVGIGVIQAEDSTYYFTQNFSYRTILFSSMPHTVRYRGAIRLRGTAIASVHTVHIRDAATERILHTASGITTGRSFRWLISSAAKKGSEQRYEVLTSDDGVHFTVTHAFTVRIRRYW